MKLILIAALCVGISFAASKHNEIIPTSLVDDVQDFIGLLPLDDIRPIIKGHLRDDGAVGALIEYLQGPEWRDLVEEVLAKPAAQEFIQWLNDKGIPVDDILAAIRERIDNAAPGVEPDETGSLRPFLDDLEGALPIGDLVALLNDKLQNSEDFQELYVEISSEEARALVEEVRAIPKAQNAAERLKNADVRVDEALEVIYEFLGWGEP